MNSRFEKDLATNRIAAIICSAEWNEENAEHYAEDFSLERVTTQDAVVTYQIMNIE